MEKLSDTQIIRISLDTASDAADVLTEAFMDYPVIRYFFADQPGIYVSRVAELYSLSVNMLLAQQWPVLGVLYKGSMAAVACVRGLKTQPESREILEQRDHFFMNIGKQAASRIWKYDALQESLAWPETHYYLEDIGVRQSYRGLGLARLLLEQIHLISVEDTASTGVGLDTQQPANVEIYQHFGYRVLAEADLDGIRFWSMFRPDEKG